MRYNAIAAKVMAKHGVAINDVHALTSKFPLELFKSKGNVHFSEAGYRKIGEHVAEAIQKRAGEMSVHQRRRERRNIGLIPFLQPKAIREADLAAISCCAMLALVVLKRNFCCPQSRESLR